MSGTLTPVIQFGTSRFLQAHADLFFSEAKPPTMATVVQSSGDPARAGRLAALAAPGGFPVHLRGLHKGETIDETRQVTSIRRALSTASQWDEVSAVFSEQANWVISNTGDAGFDPRPADAAPTPRQGMSFPAKLFHLLKGRHRSGAGPITILPLELVPQNGTVLKGRVLAVARIHEVDDAMLSYLESCLWVNSLVDRIVSQPIEPAGAVAEPYALWAIERQHGLAAPCLHEAVQLVDDLEPVQRLKLHILNLGHTVLVDLWQTAGGPAHLTVGEAIKSRLGDELKEIMGEEVLVGFGLRAMGSQSADYLKITLERFSNPFLEHRLSDIFTNHGQKVDRRICAFLDWVRQKEPDFAAPRLQAIVRRNTPV